jgi:lysyl endopeptidase
MKKYILSVLFVFVIFNLSSQIVTKRTNVKNIDESFKLSNKASIDILTMPAFDVDKLIVEDEINKGLDLPYRFGYAFKVDYNMQNVGTWTTVESGRVWSLKIVSKGAYSINLAYSKFYLPENSQLYIYNEEKTVLQGPFTSENNTKDGTFSSDLVEGSSIILEYFEPYDVKEKPEISISKIVHAYLNLFPNSAKSYGSSGSCNIDINCPEGNAWQNESNAVAMILIGDTRWCSGCMVNNT